MGYYINETSKGVPLPAIGKYDELISDGGTPDNGDQFKENLICVVQNALFDAAGYAFDEREFEVFHEQRTGRPRKWLIHPEAKRLSGWNIGDFEDR